MTIAFAAMNNSTSLISLLQHLLGIVGLRRVDWGGQLLVLDHPAALFSREGTNREKQTVFAIRPGADFCRQLGVSSSVADGPADLRTLDTSWASRRLRTLHSGERYVGAGQDLVLDAQGRAAWKKVVLDRAIFILCGTELIGDLVRWRQGDPGAAQSRPSAALWGIAGERPNYLFEAQLAGLARSDERQADHWSMMTAQLLADCIGRSLDPILPGGAPGAIVITGDDDQAHLDTYRKQLDSLGPLPVTYFLHPKTNHTRASMQRMFKGRRVELGIHPDALDSPGDYPTLLANQCAWFKRLTGMSPLAVRNHGFLNEGYWGHAVHWIHEGIRISSNLPGLDGRPLNGSFLPGRLLLDGDLTDHWSVVTAVGDGVQYVNGGTTPEAAARCIIDCAESIHSSGIPGVMVLNLHPQNIRDTQAMHAAAREVAGRGFLAWTMQDCLNWFSHGKQPASADRAEPEEETGVARAISQWIGRILRREKA